MSTSSSTEGDEAVETGAGSGAGAGSGFGESTDTTDADLAHALSTKARVTDDVSDDGEAKAAARDTPRGKIEEDGNPVTLGDHFKRVGLYDDFLQEAASHAEDDEVMIDQEILQDVFPGLVLARAPARHAALIGLSTTVTSSASSRGGSSRGKVTKKAKEFLESKEVSFSRGAHPHDIPVTAEHPILRDFATALRTARRDPAMGPTMGTVRPAFLRIVEELCKDQQGWFADEEKREENFANSLPGLWEAAERPFNYDIYKEVRGPIGVVDISLVPFPSAPEKRRYALHKARVPVGQPIAAMIEVKKERGSSGNPWPQLLTYSTVHTKGATVAIARGSIWKPLQHRFSKLPLPLLVVDGHEMEFGATVAAMRPTLGQLDHMVPLQRPANDAYQALLVAKVLLAWIEAVDATREERLRNVVAVESLPIPKATSIAHKLRPTLCFPRIVLTKGGKASRPRFVQHLARGVFRARWAVAGPSTVVIKFCRVNNDTMQQAMAANKFAPQLLHTEELVGEGGSLWRILVMDDLWVQEFDTLSKYQKLHNLTEDDKKLTKGDKAAITAQLRKALDSLHEADYVFFDLRGANVMVRRNAEEEGGWEVRLVDFEMCGRVGDASPPRRKLNSSIEWPAGEVLQKSDDDFMLERVFQQ